MEEKKTLGDYLNIMAYINMVLSVIGAIAIFINFSTTEVLKGGLYSNYTDTVINWWGIVGGIGVLIGGITLFLLLRCIEEIYFKVINN